MTNPKVVMYLPLGNGEGGLLPEFVIEEHQQVFQHLLGLVGHLDIVDIPGDSALFSTHYLVDNTPIILISHKTMFLG